MSDSVELQSVSYSYRGSAVRALDSVDMVIGVGVTGLLGPNGAGKTTLIQMLSGLSSPSNGRILAQGVELHGKKAINDWRTRTGYLPQSASWFGTYTVAEFVEYFALIRGLKRSELVTKVTRAISLVGLTQQSSVKLKNLSGGQRQRALIAQALVHEPDVLILDEPTAALDPLQRIELKKVIKRLGESQTVILSTHLIEDLIDCAHQIVVLHQGRDLWTGTPEHLIARGRSARNRHGANTDAEAGLLDILDSESAENLANGEGVDDA